MPREIDIRSGIERDVLPAAEHQPAVRAHAFQRGSGLVGAGRVGREADQPQDAGIDGAVPHSGKRQRSLQFDRNPGSALQLAGLGQRPHESARDAHRPDRVRGGRADPDPEDVEHRKHGREMRFPRR